MSDRISLKELRADANAGLLAAPDQAVVTRESLLALVEAVEAAKRCHGHGPTGYAPQVGVCELCTALARFCDYETDNR